LFAFAELLFGFVGELLVMTKKSSIFHVAVGNCRDETDNAKVLSQLSVGSVVSCVFFNESLSFGITFLKPEVNSDLGNWFGTEKHLGTDLAGESKVKSFSNLFGSFFGFCEVVENWFHAHLV
jgi:hypothetical protein